MTARLFEIRYTNPNQWLEELREDLPSPAFDRIVRVAIVDGPATLDMLADPGEFVPRGERPTPVAKARWFEASYINTSQQLVKLSMFAGWVWLEEWMNDPDVARDERAQHNRDQATHEREIVGKVMNALTAMTGLRIRKGALYVEDGQSWRTTPDMSIDAPVADTCATCQVPIYFANEQWRHKEDGAGVAFLNKKGRAEARWHDGKTLHHLADPNIELRKV